jgi:peptide/histidine transporter 3/4
MILVVELNERLTTLGVAVNLVTYLIDTMHLGGAASANAVTNFLGASFMLCLLGGFVADTYLGRYLTIAIFTAVQAVGMCVLTVSTAVPGLRPPACADPTGPNQVQRVGVRLRPVRDESDGGAWRASSAGSSSSSASGRCWR